MIKAIVSNHPRSQSPADWQLGFAGNMSPEDAKRRAQSLLSKFAHIKLFANGKLIAEFERSRESASRNGATRTVAPSTEKQPRARAGESVVCSRCGQLVRSDLLDVHTDLHRADDERKRRLPSPSQRGKPEGRASQSFNSDRHRLSARVSRDQNNAVRAMRAAEAGMKNRLRFSPVGDMVRGVPARQMSVAEQLDRDTVALRAIASHPFDAMVEAEVTTDRARQIVWYAHRDTNSNQVVDDIHVLSWTHPIVQLGMSSDLGIAVDVRRSGYAIRQVRPLGRARFHQVIPEIAGVYDPGGQVNESLLTEKRRRPGLKSVKLEMTPEQVKAFIARMNGVLTVTGAPGTGKTTVAFQRIRFLLDQQELRDQEASGPPFLQTLTRVFLASHNLIDYSTHLLNDELGIPKDVISYVPDFVRGYLDEMWQPRGDARPRQKKLTPEEQKAREAFLNLCTTDDLRHAWLVVEAQARERLSMARKAEWVATARGFSTEIGAAANALVDALQVPIPAAAHAEPTGSRVRMDAVWRRVRREYLACRELMREPQRNQFDAKFARWLMWVTRLPDTKPDVLERLARIWEAFGADGEDDEVAASTLLLGLARLCTRQLATQSVGGNHLLDPVPQPGERLVLTLLNGDNSGRPIEIAVSGWDLTARDELHAWMLGEVRRALFSMEPDEETDDERDDEEEFPIRVAVERQAPGASPQPVGTIKLSWSIRTQGYVEATRKDALMSWKAETLDDLPPAQVMQALFGPKQYGQGEGRCPPEVSAAWEGYVRSLGREPGCSVMATLAPVGEAARSWVDAWSGAVAAISVRAGGTDAVAKKQELEKRREAAIKSKQWDDVQRLTVAAHVKPRKCGPRLIGL